jgi:sugar phosphate permease
LTASTPIASSDARPDHSSAFRRRRFWNWFPMGLAYAFLYMGRYNLNVAKNALGELMTKEDFGAIFGIGTATYFVSILLNGVLVDRLGGRRGILLATIGAGVSNLALGLYLSHAVSAGTVDPASLKTWFTVLYAGNMYFQSAGAVSIVKVNASWFHVRERGGFSGIFGTMISSGLFFAYSINTWILDFVAPDGGSTTKVMAARWVFFAPAALLLVMALVELVILRDKPSDAGLRDFDTGDASSGAPEDTSTWQLVKRVLSNPVILTIGAIELCTGVLRNGVMQWMPIYVKEVLTLPSTHVLIGGWGAILMAAGIIGGNVAGWVSDLFFHSRRAPAAAGLYGLLFVSTIAMLVTMGRATNVVSTSKLAELHVGDRVVSVAGQTGLEDWSAVKRAFACVPAACANRGGWDAEHCLCASTGAKVATSSATIELGVVRDGSPLSLAIVDPAYKKASDGELTPTLRAGDARNLAAAPVLSMTPMWLGVFGFLISLAVIGTHGLLSGTATMDFAGRRAAGTAVALIDGFVYAGTTIQSIALGYLTTKSWSYWPMFLLPFSLIGFLLCTRIWSASPRGAVAR